MAGEAEEKDKDKVEDELTMVTDEDLKEEDPKDKTKETKNEDEDLDDDDDDDSVGHDDDDDDGDGDDREALKARRRVQNRNRRARHKKAKLRDERELSYLRKQNSDLVQRVTDLDTRMGSNELSAVASRIAKLENDIAMADTVMAEAMEQSKSSEFMDATGIRDGLRDELSKVKTYHTQLQGRKPAEDKATDPDPRLVSFANDFMKDNDWLTLEGNDKDSAIVRKLDNQLVSEAYDPTTEEYWEELQKRVKKRLPHHFKADDSDDDSDDDDSDDDDPKPKSKEKKRSKGPNMSSSGRERTLKKNEVYISAERREAMEEAGVWDDPEARKRMLKQYAEYDKKQTALN